VNADDRDFNVTRREHEAMRMLHEITIMMYEEGNHGEAHVSYITFGYYRLTV